ncbi:LrgB family protein [Enterococcus nangangensis]|uniref:LrgB family protein n=1 Tax=Enterococcus nangangensis TaxID=2559926 RepID=UPI0010F7247D|nr:LrgB family protein [Enterococcus nangangensis]
MNELTSNPLFGLVLSVGVFLLATKLFHRFPYPFFNPLVVTVVAIILFLKVTGISYENYYQGGSILNTLITPATVALGIPLYNTLHLLKHHARSILVGITFGAVMSCLMMVGLGVLFRLEESVIVSSVPKYVTTAIAMELSEGLGGISAVTLVMVVFTGISGSIMGPAILKIFRIEDPVAQGIALGSTAHAIGTARAMEIGEVQGAMSGLSIGVTGALTVFVAPFVLQLL